MDFDLFIYRIEDIVLDIMILSTVVWVVSGAVAAFLYIWFEQNEWSTALHQSDWKDYKNIAMVPKYCPGLSLHEWKQDRMLFFHWACRKDYSQLKETRTWEEFRDSLPREYREDLRILNTQVSLGHPGETDIYLSSTEVIDIVKKLQKKYHCRYEVPFTGIDMED